MEYFVDSIVNFSVSLGKLGYLIVFFAALAETTLGVGLILPGSTIVLLAGVNAMHGAFSLEMIILSAASGGVLGDNINYYLGYRYGRAWIKKHKWILCPRRVAQGESFFVQHGGKSVFFGRFVPVIKEVIPFIAGLMHMDKKQFFMYNISGALGWSILWSGVGYLFAYSLEQAKTWVARFELTGLLIIILFASYLAMRWWLHRGE